MQILLPVQIWQPCKFDSPCKLVTRAKLTLSANLSLCNFVPSCINVFVQFCPRVILSPRAILSARAILTQTHSIDLRGWKPLYYIIKQLNDMSLLNKLNKKIVKHIVQGCGLGTYCFLRNWSYSILAKFKIVFKV